MVNVDTQTVGKTSQIYLSNANTFLMQFKYDFIVTGFRPIIVPLTFYPKHYELILRDYKLYSYLAY